MLIAFSNPHPRITIAIACLLFAGLAGWLRLKLGRFHRHRGAHLSFTYPCRLASGPPDRPAWRRRALGDRLGERPWRGTDDLRPQESGTGRQGAGAISRVKDPRQYPDLQKPFHLGSLQAQECGETYKTTSFRVGGEVFGLRVWTAPTGASAVVRAQIERLMDSVRAP